MGIGAILADQTYSQIHDVPRDNCQTKILLDIRSGRSRHEAAWDLGLSKDQEKFLAELSYRQEQRRAVIQQHGYPSPFILRIPSFEKPQPLTPNQMQQRCQQAIEKMEKAARYSGSVASQR